MYDSVLFSTFTGSYDHRHQLIPEHFRHPRGDTNPLAPTPATCDLLSVSMDLPVLEVSYKQNQATGDLLHLASFTESNAPEVLPRCSRCQYFRPLYDRMTSHHADGPRLFI